MATFGESYDEKIVTAIDARRALGSNLALRSTLEQRADRLRARVELLEPLHGRSLGSRTVDVSDAEPFAFADSLYHAALALLRLPMRPQTAQADLGIRGAGTLRFLMQGLGRRRTAGTPDDLQRAVTDLETACRTEPEPAVPRAWLASALLSQYFATPDTSTLAHALATASEAVTLDSTRAEAHRTLASAFVYRKKYAEAVEEYRKANLLDPTDDDVCRRWGRTWQRIGRADEERKVYEAAAAKRPHCFKPRWWIASWEYNAGHFAAATREFEDMIRLAPEFWNGYLSLGALLLLNGEYTRAIDTLKLSLTLRPNSGGYSNLGTAYFNTGRLTQAVDAYNQAFQFGDATYVMWFNLGDAYYWLRNRPDQARDAYRQALRLGREQMASRSQRGQSPDPSIPATLATALARLGERDSARVMLVQSLAIDSLSSDVQYHAALTEWQLGERIAAMDWLRRAVTGGYPLPWIRDSPVHRDWRADPGFLALVSSASPAGNGGSPGKAGTR
jgi:serine/threonine-protein kinase